MPHGDKRAAYAADITYGTNNEFGFDYLRDNMAMSKGPLQRGLHYAIVDEVDSILIDEARTPLIISGPGRRIAGALHPRQPHRAAAGQAGERGSRGRLLGRREGQAGAPVRSGHRARRGAPAGGHPQRGKNRCTAPNNLSVVHHLNAGAARACHLSSATGLYRARWRGGHRRRVHRPHAAGPPLSDGLHQAVEAKEGVPVQRENQTLAIDDVPEPTSACTTSCPA